MVASVLAARARVPAKEAEQGVEASGGEVPRRRRVGPDGEPGEPRQQPREPPARDRSIGARPDLVRHVREEQRQPRRGEAARRGPPHEGWQNVLERLPHERGVEVKPVEPPRARRHEVGASGERREPPARVARSRRRPITPKSQHRALDKFDTPRGPTVGREPPRAEAEPPTLGLRERVRETTQLRAALFDGECDDPPAHPVLA